MRELIDDLDAPAIFKVKAHTLLSLSCRENSLAFKHLEIAEEYLEMAKTKDVEDEFPGVLDGVEGLLKLAWMELYERTVAEDSGFSG
jgi:hypothetical protein